jgi:hypothetical protein
MTVPEPILATLNINAPFPPKNLSCLGTGNATIASSLPSSPKRFDFLGVRDIMTPKEDGYLVVFMRVEKKDGL